MPIHLVLIDWLDLFRHFLSLSLLAVGGAITTAPDMHRYLVLERHWLTDPQFTASIALAQAAPGPNVLFVALMGWNVGLNAAAGASLPGWAIYGWGLAGALVALAGMLLPSCVLTWAATHWAQKNRQLRAVRAFKAGLAPSVVALILVTGWLLASAAGGPMSGRDWRLWLLTAATAVIVWKTRLHLLWLIGAGALLGMLGVV
ncbi:MAG: chromate transporter [Burkholderiaceae bacterium]|jgi:chromate transporter|nr:chromate transporter [Burkholderiaceae bacterium]